MLQIYHATCRAEQMTLSKLMKEEAKRSSTRSASPKVTPVPDAPGGQGGKVEKRKQEEEADGEGEDQAGKRAKVDGVDHDHDQGQAAPLREHDIKPDITLTGTTTAEPTSPDDDEYQVPEADDDVAGALDSSTQPEAQDETPMLVEADEVVVKQE